MCNKERVKTIVSEWFDFKAGIILSDETLSKLVDDITETKQCDIPVVVSTLPCEECDGTGKVWSAYYANNVDCDCQK